MKLAQMPEANAFVFAMPPIPGLGSSAGNEFVLQDLLGRSPAELAGVMRSYILAANERPELAAAFGTFRADVPQLYIDVDREKAKNLDIPLSNVFTTLSTLLGSNYQRLQQIRQSLPSKCTGGYGLPHGWSDIGRYWVKIMMGT